MSGNSIDFLSKPILISIFLLVLESFLSRSFLVRHQGNHWCKNQGQGPCGLRFFKFPCEIVSKLNLNGRAQVRRIVSRLHLSLTFYSSFVLSISLSLFLSLRLLLDSLCHHLRSKLMSSKVPQKAEDLFTASEELTATEAMVRLFLQNEENARNEESKTGKSVLTVCKS